MKINTKERLAFQLSYVAMDLILDVIIEMNEEGLKRAKEQSNKELIKHFEKMLSLLRKARKLIE